MQLFSVYTKVLKKHLPVILIYMIVLCTIILIMIYQVKDSNSYEDDRITVAVINHDRNSIFVQELKKMLEERVNLVDLGFYDGNIQSALFYQTVDYVVVIPEGFYEKLCDKETYEKAKLEKYTEASSYAECAVDMILKEYCDWWRSYFEENPQMSEEEICDKVDRLIEKRSNLVYYNQLQISEEQKKMYYYFDYTSFSIMGVVGMGMLSALFFLKKTSVYSRTITAPVSKGQIELELVAFNTMYAAIIWLLHIFLAIILFRVSFFSWKGFLLCMNTFALTIAAVGLSYLLLCFLNNANNIGVIVNLIVFCMCFISGTFIPQYLLEKSISGVAVFTPVYWYIRANDMINEMGIPTLSALEDLLKSFGIQFIFAAMFFCVAFFVTKQKELMAGGK